MTKKKPHTHKPNSQSLKKAKTNKQTNKQTNIQKPKTKPKTKQNKTKQNKNKTKKQNKKKNPKTPLSTDRLGLVPANTYTSSNLIRLFVISFLLSIEFRFGVCAEAWEV